ncbi:MAG: shikimate kinase [Nanoarchaeota archaeon]
MNIVLMGYRGTGKSSVARLLSQRLGRSLVNIDGEIIKKTGMPITDIVQKKGWDKFREIESEITEHVSKFDGYIIDCGGGIIVNDKNIVNLKKNGKIFWLKAQVDTIIGRIKEETDRPSLTGDKSFIDEIEAVLKERMPKYKKAADYEVATDNFSKEEVADKIIRILGEENVI